MFKESIAGLISNAAIEINPNGAFSGEEILPLIGEPPSRDMGDYSFPCFKLAKSLKMGPSQIASALRGIIEPRLPDLLEKVQDSGGYLNFFENRKAYASFVLSAVESAGESYGRSSIGEGKVVLVEYSSPNIAKHFHVGHLGTTIIGHALYNIFKHLGYTTIGLNFLGDWGTQFGKLITAYKKWGDKETIEEKEIDGLTEIYVKFHEEAAREPSLNDEARAWLLKMQNGDEEALSLWRWFNDLSMKEYQRIYKRLGISFDSYRGESYYNDKLDEVVEKLREKNLLTKSNGAMIVDLSEWKMPPCLVLRSDGGSLYPTRDIAQALDRWETYRFHKSVYVTALDQILHFQQWMKVVELLGNPWAKDMVHVPYGMVLFDGGKIATRTGHVIKMEDLLNEACAKTLEIIKGNPDLPDKEIIAEQVGLGAVIFNQLYNNRMKDVLFSWDRMLNFDGETGPYVQYAHARACSVLEKSGCEDAGAIDCSLLCDDYAYETVKALEAYPGSIIDAAEKFEPYIISRHLIALAQAFNKFYHNNHVITDDIELMRARLRLVRLVKDTLASGLGILGISAPQKM
jgi:arginyl-tRNA synthetase